MDEVVNNKDNADIAACAQVCRKWNNLWKYPDHNAQESCHADGVGIPEKFHMYIENMNNPEKKKDSLKLLLEGITCPHHLRILEKVATPTVYKILVKIMVKRGKKLLWCWDKYKFEEWVDHNDQVNKTRCEVFEKVLLENSDVIKRGCLKTHNGAPFIWIAIKSPIWSATLYEKDEIYKEFYDALYSVVGCAHRDWSVDTSGLLKLVPPNILKERHEKKIYGKMNVKVKMEYYEIFTTFESYFYCPQSKLDQRLL